MSIYQGNFTNDIKTETNPSSDQLMVMITYFKWIRFISSNTDFNIFNKYRKKKRRMIILSARLTTIRSSSRTPLTLIKYVPIGLFWAILIVPVLEFTLIKSFSKFIVCPSSGSTPEYFQIIL